MDQYWKSIPGWFNFNDIYDMAVERNEDGSIFVEVGCWFGKSTAYLGQLIKKKNKKIKIFAVDTWEGSPESRTQQEIVKRNGGSIYQPFLKNMKLANIEGLIEPVLSDSVKASKNFNDNSIDFVYIDGSHVFDAINNDLNAWFPKVKQGGILAGHDYIPRFDVPKAVDIFFDGKEYEIIGDSWLHFK